MSDNLRCVIDMNQIQPDAMVNTRGSTYRENEISRKQLRIPVPSGCPKRVASRLLADSYMELVR